MKNRTFLQRIIGAPYVFWAAVFIVVPLVIVMYYSFTDAAGNFTLDNMKNLSDYGQIFRDSILYSLAATAISLILAYPFAYVMSRKREKTQQIMMVLVMLPMWMSLLILTYSWMNILERQGIVNTFLTKIGLSPMTLIGTPGAVIFGMVYNYIPYMILPIYSVMSKIEPSVLEAAEDLGSGSVSKLYRVILPLSMPGVVSGITMVFVPSVSTFYISQKLGDGKILLVGDIIERQIQGNYNYNSGAALSFVLMVLIILSLALMKLFAGEADDSLYV
ncbi:MAG: ABC transporter permease [Clostridiales bacterium]|nr:ABC transporter permease [Clostridiales bacterium]